MMALHSLKPSDNPAANAFKRYHFQSAGEPSEVGVLPWIRDDYDASQEDLLCSNCRQLDFRYILHENNNFDIVLGTVDEVRGRDCAFCQRFTSTIFRTSPFAEALNVSGEDTIRLSARIGHSGWEQVPGGQTSAPPNLGIYGFQKYSNPREPV